jgi:cobalt-precorrin-5B (C1)-methyltransferase
MSTSEPKSGKGLRTGYTTGACAAAAAKAATRCLVQNTVLTEIETTLPNRSRVTFALKRCERLGTRAVCSVIKDAGDDPDCTNGAELVAEVELASVPGVEIRSGPGVAHVTKPGLGLDVGALAITPIPRRNLVAMVEEELAGSAHPGAVVVLSVPGGEEMAKQTINGRLGLVGGISILGTTGIVKPYSTAAFRASVVQAIDVAAQQGLDAVVLTTGGKSEQFAMKLYSDLREDAFIQVGDFIGDALKRCARCGIARAYIVGMMGKLSKMADGKMMTHAAGSQVNMELLASLAAGLGAGDELCAAIRQANTARHVLELCAAAGVIDLTTEVCRKVVEHGTRHAGGKVEVHTDLVDFDGTLLGRYPPRPVSQRVQGDSS